MSVRENNANTANGYWCCVLTACALLFPWIVLWSHLRINWTYSPQYEFGWLVIPLAARLAVLRWPEVRCAVGRGDPRGASAAFAFALVFAPLWFLCGAAPDWCVINYALTLCAAGITFALLARVAGLRVAGLLAFPILFSLVSVHLPVRLESWIIQGLSRQVASVAAEVIHLAGFAVSQQGNTLWLRSGPVEVGEACSGIRSLQAVVMAALFLGEEKRLRAAVRFSLLGIGVLLAISLNAVRIVILAFASIFGGKALLERWHDPAGWCQLVVAFVILMAVAHRFARGLEEDGVGLAGESEPVDSPGAAFPLLPARLAGGILALLCMIVLGTEAWYRLHEISAPVKAQMVIRWPIDQSGFQWVKVPDHDRDIALCNEALSASWEGHGGMRFSLSSLIWAPGKSTSQCGRLHSPESCFPAIGFNVQETYPTKNISVMGTSLPIQSWRFERDMKPFYVFYTLYETVNQAQGAAIVQDWSVRSRIQFALAGSRNTGERSFQFLVEGAPDYASAWAAFEEYTSAMVAFQ